jgi:hypothetical protein
MNLLCFAAAQFLYSCIGFSVFPFCAYLFALWIMLACYLCTLEPLYYLPPE